MDTIRFKENEKILLNDRIWTVKEVREKDYLLESEGISIPLAFSHEYVDRQAETIKD